MRLPTPRSYYRFLVAVPCAAAGIISACWWTVTAAHSQQLRHGIGYSDSLSSGVQACLYPNWPSYYAKVGCISLPMDLSAQPFVANRPQDAVAMAQRYGGFAPGSTTPDGNGTWLVSCDAESIQQGCARWLEERCRNSAAATEYDCSLDWNGAEGWRAMRDAYDYWATNPAGLPASTSASTPGQPRIETLSSPGPGLVAVSWVTKAGHTGFTVNAGTAVSMVAGDTYSTTVELPEGEGGLVEVTVRAFIGQVTGRPSVTRTVDVTPRTGPSPTPTPTPRPTPTPPPTP